MTIIDLNLSPEMEEAILQGRKCSTTQQEPKGKPGDLFVVKDRVYRILKVDGSQLSDFIFSGQKPSKIFVGSMTDLGGDWVEPSWMNEILSVVDQCPPRSNVWIGATCEGIDQLYRIDEIRKIESVPVRFISFEPFLNGPITPDLENIDWIIIGAQTSPTHLPDGYWIADLVEQARDYGTAVFMKKNLYGNQPVKSLIQEYPYSEDIDPNSADVSPRLWPERLQ